MSINSGAHAPGLVRARVLTEFLVIWNFSQLIISPMESSTSFLIQPGHEFWPFSYPWFNHIPSPCGYPGPFHLETFGKLVYKSTNKL